MWRSTLQKGKVIINIYIFMFTVFIIHHVSLTNTIIFVHSLFCRSFSVLVKDLDGKNHQMKVLNLLCTINEKDSYKKVNKASSSLTCG